MAQNLSDLLDRDSFLEQLYLSLPVQVQKLAASHSEEIHDAEDLRRFVQSVQ